LRGLAGATLLPPIPLPFPLPFLLRLPWKLVGYEMANKIALATAIAIPILILLFRPKPVAAYLPQNVVDGRGFNKLWVGVQVTMLIPWAIFAMRFRTLIDPEAEGSLAGLILYAGASIVVAVTSLVMAYIGLRAQQRPQTPLRVAQIGLSILLLLIALPVVIVILLVLGLAGLG
jgi:hypothetical protein